MAQKKSAETGDIIPTAAEMESILAQWRHERPDIDPRPMAVCGEVWRAGERLRKGVLENLCRCNLDFAGFDVLLTLRRQGRGEALSPSALAHEMMLSTSAMTNRLDRLEQRGLVRRIKDPNDRRGLRIELSDAGFDLADKMIVSHVETEEKMLSPLTDSERTELRVLLTKMGQLT